MTARGQQTARPTVRPPAGSSVRRTAPSCSLIEQLFYSRPSSPRPAPDRRTVATIPYAELHAHTNFSFLDGASPPDELVERAVAIGLAGSPSPTVTASTARSGSWARPRRSASTASSGRRSSCSMRASPTRPASSSRHGVRVGARERPRPPPTSESIVAEGRPSRPRPERARCPAIATRSRRTCAGSASGRAARISCCWPARRSAGGACRGSSLARTWPGTKSVPRFRQALLDEHHEGLVALSGCRDGEIARRLRVGDRERCAGGRGDATRRCSGVATTRPRAASSSSSRITSCPTTTGSCRSAALAAELGLPVVVTNDVHYATPDDRELHDVLTAIKHGRTLETLADLRRPDSESHLKSGEELAGARCVVRPGAGAGMARGDRDVGRAGGVVLGRSRLRAVPLPGLPGAEGRRRSRISSSCARPAPGSAITR